MTFAEYLYAQCQNGEGSDEAENVSNSHLVSPSRRSLQVQRSHNLPRNRARRDHRRRRQIARRVGRPHAPVEVTVATADRDLTRRGDAHMIAHARTAARRINQRARLDQFLNIAAAILP